jgi:acyl-CoA dehydrogenase
MISFEIPSDLLAQLEPYAAIARTLMRPQARQYDEQEHTRPYPFIHAIWPLERARHQHLQAVAAQETANNEPDLDVLFAILLAELLSWGDAGQFLARPGGRLGGTAVAAAGTSAQKVRFLARFAHSETPVWGAMAITEPDAGSDNSAMRTTAVLDPDTNEWVLNGQKIFITSGALSLVESDGICIVWATVDHQAGRQGIKSFVVEAHTPGVSVSPGMDKLGIRASDTVMINFDNARIPYDHVLGDLEVQTEKTTKGFAGAMKTFDASRPAVAASAVGIARAALEITKETLAETGIELDYTKPRHLWTAVERDLLEMEAQYQAAWLLTLKATAAIMHGRSNRLDASMCKVKAGTAVVFITQKAVELLGPYGYTRDALVEKLMRDAKINDLYEGTRQINLLIVARALLGYSRRELK